MPRPLSDFSSVPDSNCGLWRERGMVRISSRVSAPFSSRRSRNSPIGRVEWPIVRISGTVPDFVVERFKRVVARQARPGAAVHVVHLAVQQVFPAAFGHRALELADLGGLLGVAAG